MSYIKSLILILLMLMLTTALTFSQAPIKLNGSEGLSLLNSLTQSAPNLMRLLVICGLLLLALSLNCIAFEPVKIGGENGKDVLSMIAFNPFTRNLQDSSDLWSWGGSPIGHGQLLQGPEYSSNFGGWAPFGETSLSYSRNETPLGYTINETKHISSGQGQTWITGDLSPGEVNPTDDASDKPHQLFSSQGFFNGYGDWEPPI